MIEPEMPNVYASFSMTGSKVFVGPWAELEPWTEWAKEHYKDWAPTITMEDLGEGTAKVDFFLRFFQ